MRYLFTLTTLLLLLIGCDNRDVADRESRQEIKSQTLTLAISSHQDSASAEAFRYFAALVEKKTQGAIKIEPLDGNHDATERELLAAVQKGDIDFVVIPSAKVSYLSRPLELFDVPYMFESQEQLLRVYRSISAQKLLSDLSVHGIAGLAYWDGGFKQLITDFPLRKPEDLEKRRFRTMESTVLRQQFEKWGAISIPVAENQIEAAFEAGDIDGEEWTPHEVIQHTETALSVSLTNHGHRTQLLLMSTKVRDRLPSHLVAAIEKSADAATALQYDVAKKKSEAALAELKKQGRLQTPPFELTDAMRQAHKPLLEQNREHFGTALVEQFLQAREDWTNPHPTDLLVALDADLSGSAARSGLAIRRGIELALEEINANGGILGKQVKLVARDNSMVPSRGLDNIEVFSKLPNLLAVFSGISSPVVLAELDILHERKILMLAPWAAATPIVSNERDPNFVFRVSVRDEYAAQFLLEGALDVSDKIGFLLVNNGWGRSNFEGLNKQMNDRALSPLQVEWFDWGEKSMHSKVDSLVKKGVEAIVFVGNAVEGEKFVTHLAKYPNPPVVFSHWGITGSEFASRSQKALQAVDLRVLQTFSFVDNNNPVAKALAARYHSQYGTQKASDIYAPSGTAHAYDLMHMLAIAAERAGTVDMSEIQKALTQLEQYNGLMKSYRAPFKDGNQDALSVEDYLFAYYKEGSLRPMETER